MMKDITAISLLLIMLSIQYSCNFKGAKNECAKEIDVIGNKFIADFGENKYELYFVSDTKLVWIDLNESKKTKNEEDITMKKLRANLYMVYWKEKDGTTVSHVEDFENEILYSNITLGNQTFINLNGTLKKKD